jgi:hypothetical protein
MSYGHGRDSWYMVEKRYQYSLVSMLIAKRVMPAVLRLPISNARYACYCYITL